MVIKNILSIPLLLLKIFCHFHYYYFTYLLIYCIIIISIYYFFLFLWWGGLSIVWGVLYISFKLYFSGNEVKVFFFFK